MAALAVGADLCLLHACDQQQHDIGVQPECNLELETNLQSAPDQFSATVKLCNADQAEVLFEAQTSVVIAVCNSALVITEQFHAPSL